MTDREEAQPEPTPESSVEVPEGSSGPYQNLWVPLVLVPAGIVLVVLGILAFVGGITGEEKSLGQNLEVVMHGGANEREQAIFSMVRQLEENRAARLEGRELPWPIDATFVDDLQSAWASLAPEDVNARLVVATTLSQLDESEGVEKLLELLEIPDELDAKGEVRFTALAHLGATGDPASRDGILAFLEHPDAGLRSIAAISLQKIPGEVTLKALSGALSDPDFEVRANAALSLSELGDPSGVRMIRDLLEQATYEEQAAADPEGRKFARGVGVSQGRAAAVRALGALRLDEDKSRLVALAESEPDLTVREAAMRAIAAWDAASE